YWYVLLFTALLAGASAIIFGAAPAWQIAFLDPHQNLKQGRGTGEGSAGRHRFRSGLVVAELSLALLLLASAGVFLKSLQKLKDVDIGFRPHGLMTAALGRAISRRWAFACSVDVSSPIKTATAASRWPLSMKILPASIGPIRTPWASAFAMGTMRRGRPLLASFGRCATRRLSARKHL